jgi:hypothetical protein
MIGNMRLYPSLQVQKLLDEYLQVRGIDGARLSKRNMKALDDKMVVSPGIIIPRVDFTAS